MNSSVPEDLEPETAAHAPARIQPVHRPEDMTHPDPITGEPGAHPVGVGVGALGAGATAAAVIGAIAGPIGAIIGAAIGAVAGGLAGKQVAENAEERISGPAATNETAEELVSTAGHSGLGHVPAASLVPKTTATVAPASVASAAPDPIEEDKARQTAPETVPYSASAIPDEDFSTRRVPLTSEDTEVTIADVPNDAPRLDDAKTPLDHDVLLGASDVSTAPLQPPASGKMEANYLQVATPVETIRTTAYYKYLDRRENGRSGDELGDWVQAEEEVFQAS